MHNAPSLPFLRIALNHIYVSVTPHKQADIKSGRYIFVYFSYNAYEFHLTEQT
jgi:hypothetical protein